MSADDVYVVTLQFDTLSFEWLQDLRQRYFPPERNFLPAHLTLLHTASVDQINQLKQDRRRIEQHAAPSVRFTGLRSLGSGTAVVVDSPSLSTIRADMMQTMGGKFTRQDQQPFKAHVTVQNKVDRGTASAVLEQLSAAFVPRLGLGTGLMVWRYLGGPWSLDTVLPFNQRQSSELLELK